MIRYVRRILALAVIAVLWTSCASERKAPITSDKNTNWLERCTRSTDCHAELRCVAGLCTRACDAERDCRGFAGAVCAPLPSGAACGASSDALGGICTLACSSRTPCTKAATSCGGDACLPAPCVSSHDAGARGEGTRDGGAADGGARDAASNPEEAGSARDASDAPDAGSNRDASAPTHVDAASGRDGANDAGGTREGGAFTPQIAPTPLGNLLQLSLDVSALTADPLRDRLYAATSGQSPAYPRSLVTVDSVTGVILDAQPLGEDAGSMAISGDGATLWVGTGPTQVNLRGAAPRLVKTGNAGVKKGARTLVALRGSSTTVALISSDDRVVVLDGLVARPDTFGDRTMLDQIALGPDGHLFVTDFNGALRHLAIGEQGVTESPTTMPVSTTPSTPVASGDLMLGAMNEVWDVSSPSSPRLTGRLPEINRASDLGAALLADTRSAWMLSSDWPSGNPELRFVDLSTLSPEGRLALGSGISFVTAAPVKTRSAGVAFGGRISSGAALLILPRIPAPDPIPESRNERSHGALVEVPLAAEHLVADSARHRLYATICGDADRLPNRVVTLDATTGSVLDSVPVGSNPTALALSADGSTLWVSLEGSAEIRRVDVTTPYPTPGERYSLFAQTGARNQAEALFALPGSAAGTIAAQLYTPNTTGVEARVLVVADDGKLRPARFPTFTPAFDNYQFVGGPAGYVYGVNYSSSVGSGQYGFYWIAITAQGPAGTSSGVMVGASGGLTYDPAGFVYTSGSAVDVRVPSAPSLAGQFLGGVTAPKPGTDIVFGLSTRDLDDPLILTRGKRSTLTEEARVTLGAEGETFAYARDLVYLETDRVAFIAKATDATPASTRKRSSIWFSTVP